MAYLGRTPQVGNYDKLDSIAGSFNGVLQTFAVAVGGAAFTAQHARTLLISIDGVLQEPDVAYTVSGTNITFTAPPTTGATFFGVALGDTLDIGVPSTDTVDTQHIKADSVTAAKLKTTVTLTVANSSGSVVKTLYGAGA
jgi:hypothetical protein